MSSASAIEAALGKAMTSVTKSWKEAKRQADRNDRVHRRDLDRMRRAFREDEWSLKEAAYDVMEEAYLKASDNGTLPANARQIMYAARPLVLKLTARSRVEIWKNSSYFTQRLLPDYVHKHPAKTAGWDVVFDARGHFREPHTGHALGLGTVEVREYTRAWSTGVTLGLDATLADRLSRVPTRGPANRFKAVLFIEKEGFDPLLERVDLADRFDLGIMSTKGMSTTASRSLVEDLSRQGIPVYVLRDFDKAGFSIVHTLRTNTRRFTFRGGRPNVVDLGLRLTDVEELGLESEPVEYGRQKNPTINLRTSGATPEECNFLVTGGDWRTGWEGQRVELNAMSSRQLVDWLEDKLTKAGVKKVVPDDEALTAAYRRARKLAVVRRAITRALADDGDQPDVAVSQDLRTRIVEALNNEPAQAWDDVLAAIADADDAEAGGEDG